MITATETRKRARLSLAGKWSKAAVISLIYLLIDSALTLILRELNDNNSSLSIIISIFNIIITPPISLGLAFTFMKLKRNEDVGYFDFLTLGFSNFEKAWKIYFRMIIKLIIPIIIIITSLVISIVESSYTISSNLLYIIIPTILMWIGIIYTYIISLSLALSMNIAYDESELTAKETIKKSQELMKGNKGNLFVLNISFIGWAILACLTVGIGVIWLFPYMQVSYVCFYDAIIDNKDFKEKEVIDNTNS